MSPVRLSLVALIVAAASTHPAWAQAQGSQIVGFAGKCLQVRYLWRQMGTEQPGSSLVLFDCHPQEVAQRFEYVNAGQFRTVARITHTGFSLNSGLFTDERQECIERENDRILLAPCRSIAAPRERALPRATLAIRAGGVHHKQERTLRVRLLPIGSRGDADGNLR